MAKKGNKNAHEGMLTKQKIKPERYWNRNFTFTEWETINWLIADALASGSKDDHRNLLEGVEDALKKAWCKGFKYGKSLTSISVI